MNKISVKSIFSSRKFTLVASLLGLYLLISGISLVGFSFLKKSPSQASQASQNTNSKFKINPSLPKTEACPINGAMFTKAEKDIWAARRPITAMIENHVDSRPPSGLSKADVVYEAVAEGGITRFLTVFYCGASAEDVNIGPIRSARIYFLDFASEYGDNPLFVHQGGANNICNNCPGGVKPYGDIATKVDVYKVLSKIGWSNGKLGNDMDGQTNLGLPAIWRDLERIPNAAWEHTVIGSTDKLFEEGAKRGFAYADAGGVAWDKNFVSWNFIDGKASDNPTASDISFEFWSNKPDYDVEWKYDKAKNIYMRFDGSKEHIDFNNKEQLSASNVVLEFAKEEGPVDKEIHMYYTTTGTGKALVFQNGDVVEATWKKDSRVSRTKYFDSKGKEIAFVRGVTWVELVPSGNKINY
jgi:hypothetical protein